MNRSSLMVGRSSWGCDERHSMDDNEQVLHQEVFVVFAGLASRYLAAIERDSAAFQAENAQMVSWPKKRG